MNTTKTWLLMLAMVSAGALPFSKGAENGTITEDLGFASAGDTLPTASKEAWKKWQDRRFGMFIHWGPISQMGKQLSHSRNSPSHRTGGNPYKVAPIEPEVYDIQYKTFNPVNLDADDMMKMARAAGVQYIVFTAKHHAGFSMFDSAYTDYDIMAAPYGRDITKQLSDACHANGIQFGFYYSPRDWHHPDCDSDHNHPGYIQFYKNQMQELLGSYGPIHSIFFDGLGPGDWGDTAAEVMTMIRSSQPDAMINDRGGAGADYYTPEHNISYINMHEPWEACHTTTGQWGYNPDVGVKDLPLLMEILLYTWGANGNMLLNIGPMGDGSVNPVERERFQQIAGWWKVHGETSIRDSRGGPYIPGPWGVATRKENKVYLHIFRWGDSGSLKFPVLDGLQLQSGRRLDGGNVSVKQEAGSYVVSIPVSERNDISTTVELVLSGSVMHLQPVHRVAPLTPVARLVASHNNENLHTIIDADANTEWITEIPAGEKDDGIWVEARFDRPVVISSFSAPRKKSYMGGFQVALQVPADDGAWDTLEGYDSRLKFTSMHFLDKPVTTDRIRLFVSNSTVFRMSEWELFSPVN